MTNELDERNKIIKSFLVIGLNTSFIQKYEEEKNPPRFTQDIDIFIKELPYNYKSPNIDEKWILLIKENNVWLRIKYSYNYSSPITDLQLAECDYESPEFLLLEKKYKDKEYFPLMVTYYKDKEGAEDKNNDESYPIFSEFKKYVDYSDAYVKIPSDLNVKDILNLSSKQKCTVLLISRKNTSLPFCDITIRRKKNGSFNFAVSKNQSPYSFKYIPEILDQYPPSTENNSSVAMFCFPEGLMIKDQYKLPTWFNFVLTDEVGERTYGSTLIFWEDITLKNKENFIPFYDEYDPKTNQRKYYFIQKALCILSKFPFYHNCLLYLKQLYKISTSTKPKIPLERAICTFVDSLYISSNSIVQFNINEEKLNFYRISNYGELWDTNNTYLEVLFRVLSFKQIIIAWQGLLLEKKLFLICSSKATLTYVAHGLINLLFPFKWIHVYVPILPEKLKLFIDSPVPLIIGISYDIDLNDFPSDALILNINKNKFENYFSPIPKLKGKLQAVLEKKLKDLKKNYNLDNPVNPDKWMDFQDEVTPSFELDPHKEIDTTELRDAFYNVFTSMFKNYNKYIDWDIIKNMDSSRIEEDLSEKVFKKRVFLKDHSVNDENDFLSLFCETSLFNQFIEPFVKINKPEGAMFYFLESIKNGKGDKKAYLPEIKPDKIYVLPEIEIKDLNGKVFYHDHFPEKLENSLYIKTKKIKKTFKSKFMKFEDEWCYNINKLKKKDYPKYILYLIYEIWFNFFSYIIHFYNNKESSLLMDYAISLLKDLYDNKKITPTRSLLSKIFKSCCRKNLSQYLKEILKFANKIYKNSKFSNIFHNSYLSGLYALTENIGTNNTITLASANSYLNITAIRATILNEICSNNYDTRNVIDNIIFLNSKICPNCKYKIIPELILAGINSHKNKSYIICPKCYIKVEPYLFYLNKSQSTLSVHKFKLIPIYELIVQIDILIGEISFYKKFESELMVDIYFSTVFYFELFDLPLFVLYTPKSNIINIISQEMQANLLRKSAKRFSKKSTKSISPDRASIRSKSPDNKSGISGDISDISRNITVTNMSNLEEEIWKNIICGTRKDEILLEDKINSNEKAEFSGKYKEIKNFLGNIIQFFKLASKEKLEIFLNQIEAKQEKAIDFGIQKENEIKKHMKRISNENVTEFNYIKTDMKEKYGQIYEEKDDQVKRRNIKMNDLNINNIKKKEQVEEENQYKLEENQNNMENQDINTSMSFSGIIEMKEEEKIKNNKNTPNRENKIISNVNNNIFSSEDKSNLNIKKSINRFNSCEISSKSSNNESKTTSDKEKNKISSKENEKVINEFKINDEKINKTCNESTNTNYTTEKEFSNNNITTNNSISTNNNNSSNNNISTNINTGNEQNAEIVKPNNAKKKRKLKIINES